jgi:hypothetical protein
MYSVEQKIKIAAWASALAAFLIALIAWGQSYNWEILSSYQLFPLFGLVAFGLMWSHYIASVLRQMSGQDKKVLKQYFEITSFLVLFAIVLHPGLLLWQLWRDGAGLPPGSYYSYVAPSMRWVVTLGFISLLLFLAYEFRRLYEQKPWWKYVGYATDLAMVMIFYHGLQLGSQLQSGWFTYVWYFYGITLAFCLLYIHVPQIKKIFASVKIG